MTKMQGLQGCSLGPILPLVKGKLEEVIDLDCKPCIPATVRVFPDAPDVFACAELSCPSLDADTLEGCKKRACPFAHQRRREESAIEIAAKDAKERER